MQLTEDEILRGIEKGDAAILRFIYTDNIKLVRKIVSAGGGRNEDADDVFQDSMVVIFRKLEKQEIDLVNSSFKSLFLGIARIIWLKTIDRSIKVSTDDPSQILAGYESEGSIEEDDDFTFELKSKIFFEELKKLKSDCQKLLRLMFNGVSFLDAAKALELPNYDSVKQRYFRCKKKLINLVKERMKTFK